MPAVPTSIEEAIAQAKEAATNALNDGLTRLQVELLIPEIALQAQMLALEFSSLFEQYGSGLKIIFPDTGAASLARRDWGEVTFKISDLGSSRTPVEMKISSEDRAFLVVAPSAVEVNQIENLCNLAGDRPVLLLIPQLEDVAIVGIGYAARQLRDRFLKTIESCYYLRPLEGAVVVRSYPSAWEVWLEKEDGYESVARESQKPMGEVLESIFAKATGNPKDSQDLPKSMKTGLLGNLQKFLKALSQ